MSSRFNLICLSHDPAIVIDEPEFHSGSGGRQAVEGLLAFDAPPIPGHEHCDVVAGAFSYPLVEVYFPRRTQYGPTAEWIDSPWLRLLYRANEAGVEIPAGAPARLVEQAQRLRYELGVA